jgi:hypothetical protein
MQSAQLEAGDDVRASFLKMASGDAWANWPDGLQENPSDDGQTCERLPERSRERAIALLDHEQAVALNASEYEQLTGSAPPSTGSAFYLLRGFSTANSKARVKVTGAVAVVHSDALGGLSDLRRDPCIARLESAPTQVYTAVAYDL